MYRYKLNDHLHSARLQWRQITLSRVTLHPFLAAAFFDAVRRWQSPFLIQHINRSISHATNTHTLPKERDTLILIKNKVTVNQTVESASLAPFSSCRQKSQLGVRGESVFYDNCLKKCHRSYRENEWIDIECSESKNCHPPKFSSTNHNQLKDICFYRGCISLTNHLVSTFPGTWVGLCKNLT